MRGQQSAMARHQAGKKLGRRLHRARYRVAMDNRSPGREFSRDEHIVVENMDKRFGDYHALRDINMTIKRGQIVVIIGGSGAGKTTLLKILIGLDRPTS